MHASGRQKKKRSQMKQKVFERREKNEKASTEKPKKTRKKHSNKKPTTPNGVIIKKQKEEGSNESSSSESSEGEEYKKRAVESNWQRYEEDDEEAIRLAKLSLNQSGSEETEEEIEYITVSSNGPPPDLNTLSKSPSELFVWEKVCLNNQSDGDIHSDDVTTPLTRMDNNLLDDELDQLLDDTTGHTATTTNSAIDHTPIISIPPAAPLKSNTDELDTILDELLD